MLTLLLRVTLACCFLGSVVGCGPETPAAAAPGESDTVPARADAKFDPAASGKLTGRVVWKGEKPVDEKFLYGVAKPDKTYDILVKENPHTPRIDAETQGVAEAVVFLRLPPAAAVKAWDLPPASVEMNDRGIDIRQGPGTLHRVGFVQCGTAVPMQSKEAVFHNLRARGAAFFSLAFPDANQSLARTFDKPGLVHLSSGAGLYWASAYLFVDNAPYYALTDAQGRFSFDRVPAGPVEVMAWHPNRKYSQQERDPETSAVTRQKYSPPLESHKKLVLTPGNTVAVDLVLTESLIPPTP